MILSTRLSSMNANGLGDEKKRLKLLKWLKRDYKGILLLQETHTTRKIECEWKIQTGRQYKVYFSHGTSGSCGVATLLPHNLVKYVTNEMSDDSGRLLIIQLTMGKHVYSIVYIYAPTQNFIADQLAFLETFESYIEKIKDTKILAAGDFNIIQNPQLDKWNANSDEKPSKVALQLAHNLIDIWRTLNPGVKRFTWRRKNPLQQSRLDYWLISDVSIYKVSKVEICTGLNSDHSLIIKIVIYHRNRHGNYIKQIFFDTDIKF